MMQPHSPFRSSDLPVNPLVFACALALAACSSSSSSNPPPGGASATQALFVVPASLDDLNDDHFYDHPWPSDLRRDGDGSVHFGGFYNPTQTLILQTYVQLTPGLLDGFSPVASGYFRFTGDIDPSTLPQSPQAALDPKATVQMLDVDPASPER